MMTMIILNLTPNDLIDMRFAYSPLLEISISRQLMLSDKPNFGYGRWLDEAHHSLHGLEFPYLDAMVSCPHYIPDFLTPTPLTAGRDIEDELADLKDTDPLIIREHIQVLQERYNHCDAIQVDWDILKQWLLQPQDAMKELVEELRLYWRLALEPHWSRLTSILEADVLYRGKQLALHGTASVLQDLHPEIGYDANKIIVHKNKKHPDMPVREFDLNGQGVQLVPVIFAASRLFYQVAAPYQPMINYGPRGIGNWFAPPIDPSPSLEIALGEGRARVLQNLLTPANTGEVAIQLELTAGAVSQHLKKLREAGLVDSIRSGKNVYYHLTERGLQLLTLFA